ncbi:MULTISPECIES: YbaB/EbfC family nucleoid-associated protein [Hymenobacteraceae]|jgi:DNA-binding YbaB/EbfC family protein|uniref:Nucleoid-associated protein GCM10023183_03490 n=1 Tax=Nibribacter koreensis TaxID=1084519 RepID=A0ABP8F6Y3_9BACT|nr:YbaB/EbfC family nucleoid-associated protein [Rufibacter sp. DG15C]AMM52033.1 DNA-binding protein [Rufibacter sp. DG15C]
MFDMMGMMGKVKEMQAKMKEAQENLKHITVSAEAGGGLVKATASGEKRILKIEIDETLMKPEDREMLSDLVVAAVNKALADAGEKAQEELKKHTSGMLPNIPGLDLSGFGL